MSSLLTDCIEEDNEEVMEIISNYGSSLYESKYKKEIPTSSEFKEKLARVKFILKQPTEEFTFAEISGRGGMCKVYKALPNYNKTQKEYAVRIISL